MEKLMNSYIELAFLDVSEFKRVTKPIKLTTSIRSIKNLTNVAVPTMTLPVNPDGNYDVSVRLHILQF